MTDIIAAIVTLFVALVVILGSLGIAVLFCIAYAIGAVITLFARLPHYRSQFGVSELDAGSLLMDAAFWPFTILFVLVTKL